MDNKCVTKLLACCMYIILQSFRSISNNSIDLEDFQCVKGENASQSWTHVNSNPQTLLHQEPILIKSLCLLTGEEVDVVEYKYLRVHLNVRLN